MKIQKKIEERSFNVGKNENHQAINTNFDMVKNDSKPEFWNTKPTFNLKSHKEINIEKWRNLYPKNVDFGL